MQNEDTKESNYLEQQSDKSTTIAGDNYLLDSPDMARTFEIARKISKVNDSVMILGETGVGKTHLARYIHSQSKRAEGKFIEINCGSLHSGTSDSVLFGHVRGAFTGAEKNVVGIFEQATGGTILLNDIDYLSLEQQSKLLGVLDVKYIQRLGEPAESRAIDCRLIATSNKDLRLLSSRGEFLPDLHARINQLRIKVPSLRDRKTCIKILIERFLIEFQSELEPSIDEESQKWSFEDSLMELLIEHDWTENIRELKTAVRNIALLCEGSKHPFRLKDAVNVLLDKDIGLFDGQQTYATGESSRNSKSKLKKTLELTHWNVTRTSEIVGLSRTTIYKIIKEEGWTK